MTQMIRQAAEEQSQGIRQVNQALEELNQMMIYSCNNSSALGLSVLREWWLGFSGRSKRLDIILRILER